MNRTIFVALGLTCLTEITLAETALETITVEDNAIDSISSEKTEQLGKGSANETLGGYLDALPNVDSASYGEAVGRPVVRGMSGYRIKILQNDNEVSDLSAMSQDHAVAVAPRASERIELLKGPASLLYAAQAGGVIKITDALDSAFPEPGISGEISADLRADPNSHGVDANVSMANETWAIHLGGVQQESDPYKSGNGDTIRDSDVSTEQGQIGLGWKPNSRTEWQINATRLEKDYGIPNETPDATRINMEREDFGAKLRYQPDLNWLDQITVDLLSSDYLHDETEGGRKDGLFGQEQQRGAVNLAWVAGEWIGETRISAAQSELRVCHEHNACDDFEDANRTGNPLGASLLQYLNNTGLPFSHGHPMPDTESDILEISTVAELLLDKGHEVSLGINGQTRKLSVDPDNIQEQWVYPTSVDPDYYRQQDDHTLSLSAGVKKPVTKDKPGWEASLSYLERLPSADELFWNGFHHATDSYIFGNPNLDKERSLNLDLDFIIEHDNHRVQLSAFYYRFKDYIYQDQGYDDAGNALIDPFHLSDVWLTRQTDADFVGGSVRYEYLFSDQAKLPLLLWTQADMLEATQDNGDNLPRTSPASAEIGLRYEPKDWIATLTFKHVFKATKVAPQEEETPGYDWLSIYVQKDWKIAEQDLEFWLKGENLLDEFAQNHLSALKESAPLPGRQFTVGLNWRF